MDVLADTLHQAGLRSRFLNQHSWPARSAFQFPCEKSFGIHVVLAGEAFIHHEGMSKPLKLSKGDIAFMSRGHHHIVSTDEKLPKKIHVISEEKNTLSKNNKSSLTLVSGAYQLWNKPIHPLFEEMPKWFVLRFDELGNFDQLHMTINLLSYEISHSEIGSNRIAENLMDVLFGYTLRKVLISLSQNSSNWGHALQDLSIKKVIELMHANPEHDWTLDTLARAVGISRAGLAKKFKDSLGDTPHHYLTILRIQKAMKLLSEGQLTIDGVSAEVGFADGFSFSKSFKRLTGVSPKDFRKEDKLHSKSRWRI